MDKGFTLLEILLVLALLSLIAIIAIPAVLESRKSVTIEQLKNEMVTTVLDFHNTLAEAEISKNQFNINGGFFYNSPYYKDTQELKSFLTNQNITLPDYLALQLECEQDDNGKFINIVICYPGYTNSEVNLLNRITVKELSQGYLKGYNSVKSYNDDTGCVWMAYNNKEKSIGNKTISLNQISVSLKLYELNQSHKLLTEQHLIDALR